MADNNFNETVESLFKGMDSFLTTKTVVGEAIKFDDGTIVLPLVDVSFGVAAGAFSNKEKPGNSSASEKNNGGGGMGGKIQPSVQTGKCKESGWYDKTSGYGSGFC